MDSCKNENTSSPKSDNLNRRSLPPTLEDDYLFLRICVPDLKIQKCFQFRKDQKISDIKEQCITSLPLELKQSFNYGLFCPPTGTKCGKFLDEEKLLNEYPFSDYVGYLELRFKQRIYKSSKIDEKQFKAINTRSNLRRLLEYVHNGQVEKVTKLCSKGLDPNFHCVETGETPLTLASTLPKSGKLLMALVHGGAFLDFRNLAGAAALHRAVDSNNLEALITLLELGSSPNYKDSRGLTALYLSITRKTNVLICERLLRDKANIGAQDMQGWQEIHQACRYGLVQHLEHLLFYGADMNAKNASGNTPLHVCAVNGQEACARVILQKGVQTDPLNYSNQTPYQVAVIAGNLDLAAIIQSFKAADIVEKTINDCSDVISNNSSGIGTANSSDFTESSFAMKNNDSSNSSNSGTLEDNFSPLICKSRASIACYENGANESLLLPVYRPSKNLKDRTMNTNKYYATAPRQKHQVSAEPRTVVLHKSKRGFGFVLRGAKATSSMMELKTTGMCPALQYLDDVDKGSVADLAGLRKGDYLLAINGKDVSMASHGQVVDLIRNSGKLVTMTVVTRPVVAPSSHSYSKYNEWQTTAAPVGYATLPNKLKKTRSSSTGQVAPLPPRRDPKTTLSVGDTNSKRFYAKLKSWEGDSGRQNCDPNSKDNQPKTASIRSRPISSRITTAELEELFQRQAELSPVYNDKADNVYLKNKKSKLPEKTELRRNFYSVPDLVQITINSRGDDTASLRNHKSQDHLNGLDNLFDESSSTSSQLSNASNLKAKTKNSIYGHCVNGVATKTGMNSSFNPNNQAIIYAAPSDLNNQYSTLQTRNQVRKSASVHTHNSLNRISRLPLNNQIAGQCQTVRYRPTSARNSYATAALCLSPPPIPDPDYSQSDEDSEQAKKAFKMSTLPLPGTRKCSTTKITLRNGSGGGGGGDFGVKHFNVEEIRKARLQLRNSTSFPVNYSVISTNGNEDGDNSSSGVSSDQEIPQQQAMTNGVEGTTPVAEKHTVTFKVNSDTNRAVELKGASLVVLPPPDFVGNVGTAAIEVLEPPPQFSDNGNFN